MTFSRDDRPSVSIMMKNNGKMMDFDRFMYTQSKSGVRQNPIRKLSNFGQNWVPLMVQLPVSMHTIIYDLSMSTRNNVGTEYPNVSIPFTVNMMYVRMYQLNLLIFLCIRS